LPTRPLLSASRAAVLQGLLWYGIEPSDIPASFPIHLYTDDFKKIAPGLPQRYPHANMSLLLSAVDAPRVLFDPASTSTIHATVPSVLDFRVRLANGSVAPAFSLSCPVNVSLRLWVEQRNASLQVVHGNLSLLSVTPLSVRSTSVGDVHIALLSDLLAALLARIVLPAANAILADGFPLPASGGLLANHTVLSVEGGALQVRTDFIFNPTTMRQMMRRLRGR
jgi:hypothetical protein